jgi:hypothetical protein
VLHTSSRNFSAAALHSGKGSRALRRLCSRAGSACNPAYVVACTRRRCWQFESLLSSCACAVWIYFG